jgi:beta-phosphoglucomutase-like phosphatase (HAD superfamily)
MSLRALFFDVDGTLWDSETANFQAWVQTYREYGQGFGLATYADRSGSAGFHASSCRP